MGIEAVPRELVICQDVDGKEAFTEWLESEKLDSANRARIQAWLDRLEDGNFSQVKSLGRGLYELRLDFGPGFRIYFGQRGTVVHLIRGGNKATQVTDIGLAEEFWRKHD